jgi:hypothetical protein
MAFEEAKTPVRCALSGRERLGQYRRIQTNKWSNSMRMRASLIEPNPQGLIRAELESTK